MAARLGVHVRRGEVDNTVRGRLTGRVWIEGVAAPLELELSGNGWPDVAGCRVVFRRAAPAPCPPGAAPAHEQRGTLGDFTASRKVRVPGGSSAGSGSAGRPARPAPWHWGNGLYLEWFSERSGRVVIEGADFEVDVSVPAWRPTPRELEEQKPLAAGPPGRFSGRAADGAGRSAANDTGEEEDGEPDEAPMDEFEWERFMRESDRRTETYMALFERYEHDPDRDMKVAREMGWEWLADALEEQGPQGADAGDGFDPAIEDVDLPDPDPLREGIDWVRTGNGELCHPLYDRARRATGKLWETCRDAGLASGPDETEGDPLVRALACSTHRLVAKLAGALNGLSRHDLHESGFVIASLKRAMKYLNESLGLLGRVRENRLVPAGALESFAQELFAVRAAMHEIMEEHRRRLGA